MKTIVVGYDGSDAAERALGRAAEIAQVFSARLVFVSVSGLATVAAPVSGFEPTAELGPPAIAGPVAPGGTVPLPKPVSAQEPEELARRRSEEHTSELQSRRDLVCRLLLEKKKINKNRDLDRPKKQNT